MSKKNFILLSLVIILCSCNDNALLPNATGLTHCDQENLTLDGTYPYAQGCQTKSSSVPNWEKWEKVRLSSGAIATDSVAVPWANTIISSNIPSQVRRDIKAENGWMLLKYTVNGNWGVNNNYMFFYNRYTGILKVFYYLNNGTVQSNYGIWHLHIDVPQKLFAFTKEIADPIEGIYQTQDIYCTNITSTDSKGFVQGWNCFQIELAYDPQFIKGELTINPVSRTSSNIILTGAYDSSSKGTIISTTTTNPTDGVIKGVAKAAGGEALSFLKKEAKANKFATKILNIAGDIASGGVSTIVKGGINLLFSSFIGRFNKEQSQNYDLQFTTNGTVKLAGSITTEVTGGIVPANLNLSKKALGIRLGVWNLSEQPTIYFYTTAKLYRWGKRQPTIFHLWKMQGKNLEGTSNSYNFVINPDILRELKSNKCKLRYCSIVPFPDEIESYSHGSLGGDRSLIDIINGHGEIVYEKYREITNFYGKFEVKIPQDQDFSEIISIPRVIFLPNGNAGVSQNTLIKATTTLCVNNNVNDTIVITKTFVPKLEWNPFDYELNKNYGEYPFSIIKVVY